MRRSTAVMALINGSSLENSRHSAMRVATYVSRKGLCLSG